MSKTKAPTAPKTFEAKFWERPGLSADEVQEVKDAFDLFDGDSSGAVSVNELIEAMQSLGLEQKNEAVFNMIKEIDTDGSGELEFQEFLEMMTARLTNKTPRADIERVFKLFDADRTGEISLDNLKRVASELGEEVSNEELQEMVMRNDVDKDGAWTLDDFYAVMTSNKY
jgi:centrin-1